MSDNHFFMVPQICDDSPQSDTVMNEEPNDYPPAFITNPNGDRVAIDPNADDQADNREIHHWIYKLSEWYMYPLYFFRALCVLPNAAEAHNRTFGRNGPNMDPSPFYRDQPLYCNFLKFVFYTKKGSQVIHGNKALGSHANGYSVLLQLFNGAVNQTPHLHYEPQETLIHMGGKVMRAYMPITFGPYDHPNGVRPNYAFSGEVNRSNHPTNALFLQGLIAFALAFDFVANHRKIIVDGTIYTVANALTRLIHKKRGHVHYFRAYTPETNGRFTGYVPIKTLNLPINAYVDDDGNAVTNADIYNEIAQEFIHNGSCWVYHTKLMGEIIYQLKLWRDLVMTGSDETGSSSAYLAAHLANGIDTLAHHVIGPTQLGYLDGDLRRYVVIGPDRPISDDLRDSFLVDEPNCRRDLVIECSIGFYQDFYKRTCKLFDPNREMTNDDIIDAFRT